MVLGKRHERVEVSSQEEAGKGSVATNRKQEIIVTLAGRRVVMWYTRPTTTSTEMPLRRQQGPPKQWYPTTTLHSTTTLKTLTRILTSVKTSNLTWQGTLNFHMLYYVSYGKNIK
jgi:hypothetical protein